MRVLHTSDWHLGRSLHQVDLLTFQEQFLDHLVAVVERERVDVVLVSGDVYDRAIAPVPAVELLSTALQRLAAHAVVVVTSGNHDSASRLGFGAALMTDGIKLRTRIADVGQPVVLRDEHGPVLIYPFPYLEPDVARTVLTDGPSPLARSHEAVTRAAMDRVRADLVSRGDGGKVRSIVMAHAFVYGGQPSESERDLRIGGVDSVPSGIFAGVDYVALGHLHGPQSIPFVAGQASEPGQAPMLRYSGSPLAYSFSEIHHHKSSAIIDFDAGGVNQVRLIDAPVPRALADLRGPIDEVLTEVGHRDDWVRVIITDELRPTDMFARVRAAFPNALVVQHVPANERTKVALKPVESHRDPLDVASEFLRYVAGVEATPPQLRVLQQAYERAGARIRAAADR